MSVFDQPQPISNHRQQVHVVADKDHGASIGGQRVNECFTRFDIKVVCRLIEDQQMRGRERG